jgi:hypothetical protein
MRPDSAIGVTVRSPPSGMSLTTVRQPGTSPVRTVRIE